MKPEAFVPGSLSTPLQPHSRLKCLSSAEGDRVLRALHHTPASSRYHLLGQGSPPLSTWGGGNISQLRDHICMVGKSCGYDWHSFSLCNRSLNTPELCLPIHQHQPTAHFSTDAPMCRYRPALPTRAHQTRRGYVLKDRARVLLVSLQFLT